MAIGDIAGIAFEERNASGVTDLAKGFMNDAAHIALMRFVGSEDIEVFQPGDERQETLALSKAIEHVLGVTVHVQRAQRGKRKVLSKVYFTGAIGCSG